MPYFTFGWAAYPSYQVPEGVQGAFPARQTYIEYTTIGYYQSQDTSFTFLSFMFGYDHWD